ncbi:MAG: CHC2 zinc finger domain-containing protein, partial [Blastocatellia bacterium]
MNKPLGTYMPRSITEIKNEVRAAYPLAQVLEYAGVKLKPAGGAWRAALCPFPNHVEAKPSFKVNRHTPDRFYCFGCDARGGIFEFLRDYYGYKTLNEQLNHLTGRGLREWVHDVPPSSPPSLPRIAAPASAPGPSTPDRFAPAPPDIVNEVYKHLLALLTLDPSHRVHLSNDRSFPDAVAFDLGYRTLPVSRESRSMICDALRKQHLDLWRVPGFFRLRRMGQWCLGGSPSGERLVTDPLTGESHMTTGFLIPTRSPSGQVLRLVIRNDPPTPDIRERLTEPDIWPQKYMALSSAHRIGGASATAIVHTAGPADGGEYPGVIWVTEGQLKADISAYHLNARILGQPGVGQAIQQVQRIVLDERAACIY